MLFVWIMWAVVLVACAATGVLLTGHGSSFVTGWRQKSPAERAKLDREAFARRAGKWMLPIDVALIVLVAYVQLRAVPAIERGDIHRYGGEITLVSLGLCLLIVVIALLSMRGEK